MNEANKASKKLDKLIEEGKNAEWEGLQRAELAKREREKEWSKKKE
jgi:Txe/YoeB family toxin of Txe-Axe toxin-antitoxin module